MDYPAILFDDDGQIGVIFPDLPNCVCTGSSIDDAIYNAGEKLAESLDELQLNGQTLPNPTPEDKVKLPDTFGRTSFSVVMITPGLNYQSDRPPHW